MLWIWLLCTGKDWRLSTSHTVPWTIFSIGRRMCGARRWPCSHTLTPNWMMQVLDELPQSLSVTYTTVSAPFPFLSPRKPKGAHCSLLGP